MMAHPRHRQQAGQLKHQHLELDITIVDDAESDGLSATLRTAKAAWAAILNDPTHHLVLQKDILLCPSLAHAATRALQVTPHGADTFFANWVMSSAQALCLAALTGASWTPVVDPWTPTPPDIAHLGRGNYGSIAHFEPLTTSLETVSAASHAVLRKVDVTAGELTDAYAHGIAQHPETAQNLFNKTLFFYLGMTMLIQSAIARTLLHLTDDTIDDFLTHRPWALPAIAYFEAGALHPTCPRDYLREASRLFTLLYVTGLRTGFITAQNRPCLSALAELDTDAIKMLLKERAR